MKLHEYQAKGILKKYQIKVPKGKVAFSTEEAVSIAKELGSQVTVVKAQIHAGGRGKGGGVKLAKNSTDVETYAHSILGMQLITHQTGPEGKRVEKILIEEGSQILHELYLAILMDRATSKVCIMASKAGGMEIEEVAEKNPELLHKVFIDPFLGLSPFQARELVFKIGIHELSPDPKKSVQEATQLILNLYKAFMDNDGSLFEINPLIITKSGEVMALDAKVDLDDNATFRHPEWSDLRDLSEEDPQEVESKKWDLNFIKLDGNIGCMVNGAGLAMATMDIVKRFGGDPANFLDVGGGATEEKVREAFKIILKDTNVRGIFINIFGGIMKCDTIASGVIGAAKELQLHVPLIVRLEGTNVDKGKEMLAQSGLKIIAADSMEDGAKKIVAAIKG